MHGPTGSVTGVRDAFLATYGFPLDDFQVRALDALDAGHHVLVAAPTGSGKTVVAEYAVAEALAAGSRVFYTTPVKALSNQKFADLVRRHGAARVGLLTGDNAINPDAPVVVMTTEVLRNMIYARSTQLDRLASVVLDEVHYLQDAYRGPVWEEVMIHLPPHIQLVCLSATVSNAEELAAWMRTIRGDTTVVVEDRRPVRLDHLYVVADRGAERLHVLPTLVGGTPNPEASQFDDPVAAGRGRDAWRDTRRRRFSTPRRIDVVEQLDDADMLPAIYFIFSRNACDDAARALHDAGVQLTTGIERRRIRAIVDDRLRGLAPDDLDVLGEADFRAALEAGIAAHHAGMVPAFKEAVEACFVEGLVKVVFATETLAVGINMPARAVVIEKLTKFTGEHHTPLTPAEYTQLTGRAGRRGIDDLGYALVLWNPFVTFDQVAALAASRSFHLRSAFRPTYNMAANLVRSYAPDEARHLLNLSFAQFQADDEVVGLEARLERRSVLLAELRATARSPYGDLEEYRRLIGAGRTRRDPVAADGTDTDDGAIDGGLARLRPGDVVWVDRGAHAGRALVVGVGQRKGGVVRVRAITPDRQLVSLQARDFERVPKALASVALPRPFEPNRHGYQKEVARLLDRVEITPPQRRARPGAELRPEALAHPVNADARLGERLAAAARAERVQLEVDDLRRRIRQRGDSLARRFDEVLRTLVAWGYVELDEGAGGWSLTEAGTALARLFHESDLVVAEALRVGLFDDVDAATLAALASCCTYEHRSPEPAPAPWFPSAEARRRFEGIRMIGEELRHLEERARLPLTRLPDPRFAAIAWSWAKGQRFAEVVETDEVSGGDFVRNVKQVIDLVRQIAEVAPSPVTRAVARAAEEALNRGVVASVVASVAASVAPTGASAGASAGASTGVSAPAVRVAGDPA